MLLTQDTVINDTIIDDTKKNASMDKELSVIHKLDTEKNHGQTISKIIKNNYYCFVDANINELADELDNRLDITAIGVVDENNKFLGAIIRQDFFNVLGKRFGRDLYKNKSVSELMLELKTFNSSMNIFSIAEEISHVLKKAKTEFFALVDDEKFKGIFSTKEVLIYLSDMTQNDIALARSLQSNIVRQEKIIEDESFCFYGASKMAKGVGGDFYDIIQYGPNQYILALCDVSGKGISASLITASISGMFGIYDFNDGLKNLIIKLNKYIYESFSSEKFITGVFIDFNTETGLCKLFDAGHGYLYLLRDGNNFKLKTKNTFPIGITDDFDISTNVLYLKSDDLLVLITDGIAEQNNSLYEEYGENKALSIISSNRNQGLENASHNLFNDINEFRGSQNILDDMTLLIIEKK